MTVRFLFYQFFLFFFFNYLFFQSFFSSCLFGFFQCCHSSQFCFQGFFLGGGGELKKSDLNNIIRMKIISALLFKMCHGYTIHRTMLQELCYCMVWVKNVLRAIIVDIEKKIKQNIQWKQWKQTEKTSTLYKHNIKRNKKGLDGRFLFQCFC